MAVLPILLALLRPADRYGAWVHVRTSDGTAGWVEQARVALLPPVPLF